MKTYIALLRGINVGGHHSLPMRDLKIALEKSGCVDVRTYIQSGNVVFRSPLTDGARFTQQLTAAVSRSHGFEPRVLLLTRSELERAAAANPYAEADANPTSVHLFFLSERPKAPNLALCEAVKAETERFELKGKILYLHTPDGFGRSKLAERAERLLGVDATARNWRTVTTLLGMAKMVG